jgi:fatty-acyl-CoA synthase
LSSVATATGFETIADVLPYWAARAPDRECLVIGPHRVTYGQAHRRTRALAAALLRLGVRRGDRVALWLPNGPEWVYAYLAAASIGAVIVPVNTRYKLAETCYVLEQSGSSVLVFMDTFLQIDFAAMVEALPPDPIGRHVVCVNTRKVPRPGWIDFADLVAASPPDDAAMAEHRPRPEDPALIQYTSGTTAAPKGAVLSHAAYVRTAAAVALCQALSESDRFFSGMPFFHCSGSMHAITTVLVAGSTLVDLPRWDAEEALHVIDRERCTVAHGRLPFTDLAAEDWRTYPRRIERAVTTGSPEFLLRLHDEAGITGISNVYGMTETCGNFTLSFPDDPLDARVRSNGRPHPGLEVVARDPRTCRDLPPGERGELWLRGWNLFAGYYLKPDETAQSFDAAGWFRTGDLGSVTPDGALVYHGRLKEMLRVGGENVAPAEVEGLLCAHPSIREAAVVAMPDRRLDEVVCAFVALRPGRRVTEAEVIEFCRARIAGFKVPRRVVFVDELPRTATHKIETGRLRERARGLG